MCWLFASNSGEDNLIFWGGFKYRHIYLASLCSFEEVKLPVRVARGKLDAMMVHCAGCARPILDRFLLNVLDRAWHVECVQCCECSCNLTEKCFSRDGKLYCKIDFFR